MRKLIATLFLKSPLYKALNAFIKWSNNLQKKYPINSFNNDHNLTNGPTVSAKEAFSLIPSRHIVLKSNNNLIRELTEGNNCLNEELLKLYPYIHISLLLEQNILLVIGLSESRQWQKVLMIHYDDWLDDQWWRDLIKDYGEYAND